MELRRTVVVRLATLIVLGLMLAPAHAAAEPPLPITVDYQGTIDETKVLGGTGNWSFHLQWDFEWDVHSPLVEPSWRIKMLTGTVSAVVPPPNQATSCVGTLSDSPKLPVLSYQYTPGLLPGKKNVVQVAGAAPGILLSSSPLTPFGFCGNEQKETHWEVQQQLPDPTQPSFEYTLGTGTVEKKFTEDYHEPPGRSDAHFVLDSALTVNGKAPAVTTTPKPVRDMALAALRAEEAQAAYPCLSALVGLGLFSGGGPIGVLAGGTMFAVAGPQCAQILALIVNLQRAYKDPPAAGFRSVAHVIRRPAARVSLPSCTTQGGSMAGACRRLHSLALAWVTATQRVRESSLALATDVGREGAARGAHNNAAVKLQSRAALLLLPTIRADLRRQAAAGAALASLLRRDGMSGSLSSAQSKQAIERIVERLGRLGVTRGELEAESPAQLTPAPLDLLSVLSQRLP